MTKQYPFYLKSTTIILGLVLISYALFNLREVLVPLAFGLMLAILLNPLANYFQKWKIKRVWSILLTLLVAALIFCGIAYFLSTQMASFSDEFPLFKKNFARLFSNLQHDVQHRLNVPIRTQDQYLNELKASIKPMVGSTLSTVVGTVGIVFLMPVYIFCFLYYKPILLNFLYEVFAEENSTEVHVVLKQGKGAIQNYMIGLLIEALIVAAMNSSALLILGVQYAILLGVMGALLNMLPFIGGIIAVALPLLVATITGPGFKTQIWIIVAYLVIQFIDNHFLMPYVVSSKVKINALVSIVAVLLGGALWGVSGMFLSIPFIGILKIIFDRIPELKPWGKLLGDEIPQRHKGQIWDAIKKRKKAVIVEK